MEKLTVEQLFSLEQYARRRNEFRAQVLEHKSRRRLAVGPNMTWCFEDRLTIQYQIQEMLRAEKVFEPEGIREDMQGNRIENHICKMSDSGGDIAAR